MSLTPLPNLPLPDEPAIKAPAADQDPLAPDHFVQEHGFEFAGRHVIADFWDAEGLDDLQRVERALRQAAVAAGATLLSVDLHHFTPNNGVSGVAVLAESHISVHTWPERGFAALDVFMCGTAQPMRAIEVLKAHLNPAKVSVTEQKRGMML